MMDDYDGQMIFGDLVGLNLPDIHLTGEEKPWKKNLTQETCPDQGSNPGPLHDKRTCYCLFHSGGLGRCVLHVEDGIIQSQLIIISKVQETVKQESFPAELKFPLLPISQLSCIITPVIYSQDSYLVYVLSAPLIQSKTYRLHKVLHFQRNKNKVFLCTLNLRKTV